MKAIHECKCAACQSGEWHAEKDRHREINVLMARLDERQRRWYAAVEAKAIGRGGIARVHEITGLDHKTIRRGKREVTEFPEAPPDGRIRAPGAGRPRLEQSQPGITRALEELVEAEEAGDPEGKRRWVRASVAELKRRLSKDGFQAGDEWIRCTLLDMGYRLRLNAKTKSGKSHPQRDEQFRYIERQRQAFQADGEPVISVDTKKRS